MLWTSPVPWSFQSISHLLIHYMLVTFIIAEACLLAESVRNAYHTKYRTVLPANPPSCETLRKGVFGAGAAFVVFTGIVSELDYVFYSKSDEGVIPTKDTGSIQLNHFVNVLLWVYLCFQT
ncbi:putative modifying wall lignin-1/2 [Helianthus anomalus]